MTEEPKRRSSKVIIVGGGAILAFVALGIFMQGGLQVTTTGVTTSDEACRQAVSSMEGKLTGLRGNDVAWSAVDALRKEVDAAVATCSSLANSTAGASNASIQASFRDTKALAEKLGRAQHANVRVFANQGWQDSGLKAVGGDLLFVTASGKWSISGPVASAKYGTTGPDGYEKNPSWGSAIYGGRIGSLATAVTADASPQRAYTGTGKFLASSGGPVRFRINDDDVGNNDGQLDVELVVLPDLSR